MLAFLFYLGGTLTGETVTRRDFLRQTAATTGVITLASVLGSCDERGAATTFAEDELLLETEARPYIETPRDFPYEFDVFLDRLDDVFSAAPKVSRLAFVNNVSSVFGNRLNLERLAASPRFAQISVLQCQHCNLGPEGMRALAASPYAANLETLILTCDQIGDEGARALASSPHLAGLKWLNLIDTGVGPRGLQAIVTSPYLAGLETLYVWDSHLGNEGARAFAEQVRLPNLRDVLFSHNGIGDEGAFALTRSRGLEGLTQLLLHAQPLGEPGKAALVGRFGEAVGISDDEEALVPEFPEPQRTELLHLQQRLAGLNEFDGEYRELREIEDNFLAAHGDRVVAPHSSLLAVNQVRRPDENYAGFLRRLDRRKVCFNIHLGKPDAIRLPAEHLASLGPVLSRAMLPLRQATVVVNPWDVSGLAELGRSTVWQRLTDLRLELVNPTAQTLRTLAACERLPPVTSLAIFWPAAEPDDMEQLLRSSWLGHLRELKFEQCHWGYAWPQVLATAAGGARSLSFRSCGLEESWESIVAERRFEQTERLRFQDNSIGDGDVVALASREIFPAMRTLELIGEFVSDDGAEHIAASRLASQLRALNLCRSLVSDDGVAALAASPNLAGLRALNISESRATDRSTPERAWHIGRSPHLTNLRYLEISENPLGVDGARALATAKHLTHLQMLDVGHSGLGDDGLAALAVSRTLSRVTTLNLYKNEVSAAGLTALGRSTDWKSLRWLLLDNNDIGPAGGAALAAGPAFANLSVLRLFGSHVGDAGVAALAASPSSANLRVLLLLQNALTDIGALALAQSPHLQNLYGLELRANQFTTEGTEMLKAAFGTRARLEGWHCNYDVNI